MVRNDMTELEYAANQQALATAWKQRTPSLPDAAKQPAPWINHKGQPRGRYSYCLPAGFADHNLLPNVRQGALALFEELGIPWHCGIHSGPGNHLLSSQVQCVNALYPMVNDPDRLTKVFGPLLDIAEVLPIEPGRYLTFEYIGAHDYFGEGKGRPRTRGSMCTSVDAAFLYKTTASAIELALIEWKYTESYLEPRVPVPAKDQVRAGRYRVDIEDPRGPIRAGVLPIELLFDEPLYQLTRQQLLAHRIETDHAEGASAARILHVLSPENDAYQRSLVRAETRRLGATVDEVWFKILARPDRFMHIDPGIFLNPATASSDYIDRYGPSQTGGEGA